MEVAVFLFLKEIGPQLPQGIQENAKQVCWELGLWKVCNLNFL